MRVSVLSQTQVFLSCLRLFICKISADQYSGLFTAALVLFLKMHCTVCKLCHFAYLSSKHEVSGTVYSTGINSYVVFFFWLPYLNLTVISLYSSNRSPESRFFFLVALINLFIDSNLFAWQVVLFLTNIENRLLLFATSATRTAESVTVASLRVEAPALSVRASHFFFSLFLMLALPFLNVLQFPPTFKNIQVR